MKNLKVYALVTQFIFQLLILGVLGWFIGYRIDPDGVLKGILAVVGVVIGVIAFIIQLVKMVGVKDGE
ncbi:MAG: hypothetical protein J6Y28_06400 [Acholeplasmatales bacterium]|nr:hypothetical protein [Acholeplasmatales bacterium]